MDLSPYFKSITELDPCAVVLCDLEHRILYMNPAAAERYAKRGGRSLVGQSLLNCHNADSAEKIDRVLAYFAASPDHNRVYTSHNSRENMDAYMVALRDDCGRLIGYYEKHEYRSAEAAKFYEGM